MICKTGVNETKTIYITYIKVAAPPVAAVQYVIMRMRFKKLLKEVLCQNSKYEPFCNFKQCRKRF